MPKEKGAPSPKEMGVETNTLQKIIEDYKKERGLEFTLAIPSTQETEGFNEGDSITVERSNKAIEKDWKILGFAKSNDELFAICLKEDGTYKALEPSFLKKIKEQDIKDRKRWEDAWDEVKEKGIDGLSQSFSDVKILRKPETREENSRVQQAKSLLTNSLLKQHEIDYWRGIIQNGGQENPPYKPQLQLQRQRQKK